LKTKVARRALVSAAENNVRCRHRWCVLKIPLLKCESLFELPEKRRKTCTCRAVSYGPIAAIWPESDSAEQYQRILHCSLHSERCEKKNRSDVISLIWVIYPFSPTLTYYYNIAILLAIVLVAHCRLKSVLSFVSNACEWLCCMVNASLLQRCDSLLSSNAISGTIPNTISTLNNLIAINLGGNSFSGALPSTIGLLGQLESLFLHHNFFSGVLPNAFGGLIKLKDLQIHRNSLRGPLPGMAFGGMVQLTSFIANNNSFDGTLPIQLRFHNNLRSLDLTFNRFLGSLAALPRNVTSCVVQVASDSNCFVRQQ
jgi:hypothetical protein